MGIMALFTRFLIALGLLSGPEGSPNRELSVLLKDIKKNGPPWYRPLRNTIEPEFAEYLVKLKKATLRLASLFRMTVLGEKAAQSQTIDALLAPAMKARDLFGDSFSFDAIKPEARAAGGDLIAAMDDIFRTRIAVFKSPEVTAIRDSYRAALKLASLCDFDFDGLLKSFGKQGVAAGTYGPCFADAVVVELADLRFLVDGLLVDEALLGFLLAILPLAEGLDYEAADLETDFRSIALIVKNTIPSDRLAAVARAASGNPAFNLGPSSEEMVDPAGSIAAKLNEDYSESKRLFMDAQASGDLERMKRAVFEDRELVAVTGYTKEISALFAGAGLSPLRYCTALSIAKSFGEYFLLPFIQRSIDATLIGIEFTDQNFRRSLALAHSSCTAVVTEIKTLEGDHDSPSASRFLPIIQAIEGGHFDGVAKSKAARSLEEHEKRADRILQAAFTAFMDLHSSIDTLIADLRSRQSKLVSNALLVSQTKPQLLFDLESSSNLLADCVRLLRHFAVDLSDAKRAVKTPTAAERR
ncbi:MAG: hypothetical protein WCQ50_13010 [Spirochaetota bacterium]